jgi:non-homologous end joining protein Ku
MVSLLSRVIDLKTMAWYPVQEKLFDIISAKKNRRRPAKTAAVEQPANVVNIMDSLRKSLPSQPKRPKARSLYKAGDCGTIRNKLRVL